MSFWAVPARASERAAVEPAVVGRAAVEPAAVSDDSRLGAERDVGGSAVARRAVVELADPASYLAHHSRSFRFAVRLMPRADRNRVARLYAWCRYTDNLVDGVAGGLPIADEVLDDWLACSRTAYEGRPSGVPLVDVVIGEMARREIPFDYATDLVQAMRSDLHFRVFPDLDALRVYNYRAAGVVGRWLTELYGVRDPWMLERAALLGGAMQLTNILRDVGEDWERGRVYLPVAVLGAHGLSIDDIGLLRRGACPIDDRYRGVMEELIAVAERDYRLAGEAVPYLPPGFRRAAVVAGAVYRGIHESIRQHGYDNLRRRAYTTASRKTWLSLRALAAPSAGWGRPVRYRRVDSDSRTH